MKRLADSPYPQVFHFTIASLFGAVVLRSLIRYWDNPNLSLVTGLLIVWLVMFIGALRTSSRWPQYFSAYLVFQSALTLVLLFMTETEDYFAALFGLLSMQIMQKLNPRSGVRWIGAFAILMTIPMVMAYGVFAGVVFALIYTFGSALLASYTLTTRRAQEAHRHNQNLTQQLREAHWQLQTHVQQNQQLVAIRERHYLARELHDSVTQTLFTMGLTTQSALLLLERDPGRVGSQLARLSQLAQSALAEIQMLMSEQRPNKVGEVGLVVAIRQYLSSRNLPEGLSVSLEVEDSHPLELLEVQGLFRIVQEALNNVVKHSQVSQAHIQLHLVASSPWIKITDEGQGFDLQRALRSNRIGLTGMHERAVEIGWELQIVSSPGAGACIQLKKSSER